MQLRSWVPLQCALAAACFAASGALGQTFSLNPVADAFVSLANPGNNYGGAGAFHVSAAGLPQGEFQALLQFDLADAKSSFDTTFGPGNWKLSNLSLQLTASNPNNPLFNPSAAGEFLVTWMFNDGWTEGAGTPMTPGASGITWNELPTFLSIDDENLGLIGFSGATSGTEEFALTVSPGIAADTVAGSLASIRLRAAPSDTDVSGLFNSRSFNNAANRPVLILTGIQIPEPSSVVLLVNVVSVGGLRRIRRPNSETR